MANTWTYRQDVATGLSGRSLAGYDVEASDGSIGSIDEQVRARPGAGYVVVDTGFWIFGKKRLIPAGVVQGVDHDDGKGLHRHDEGPDQGCARLRRGDT